jgi:hypothetical protein
MASSLEGPSSLRGALATNRPFRVWATSGCQHRRERDSPLHRKDVERRQSLHGPTHAHVAHVAPNRRAERDRVQSWPLPTSHGRAFDSDAMGGSRGSTRLELAVQKQILLWLASSAMVAGCSSGGSASGPPPRVIAPSRTHPAAPAPITTQSAMTTTVFGPDGPGKSPRDGRGFLS